MSITIAILGGTGSTGQGVVQRLLNDERVNLRLYVRSESKLLRLFPSVASNPRVTIFEGAITDVKVITECVRGAETIICTLGENENRPGIHVIRDGARGIAVALKTLRSQSSEPLRPRLIVLSSASWNPRFMAATPKLVLWIIHNAFNNCYADLLDAHAVLEEDSSLFRLTLIQPPAIMDEAATGHVVSVEDFGATVAYGDLAAGFVEVAMDEKYAELGAVGVYSRGGDNPMNFGPEIFKRVVVGLGSRVIPGFWAMYDTWFSWSWS